MTDLDQSGNNLLFILVDNGPTLGWILTPITAQTQISPGVPNQIITVAGTYAVAPGDTLIVMNLAVAGAVILDLPPVTTRFGVNLSIVDFSGKATTTMVPSGTDEIMGANSSWEIDSGGVAQSGAGLTWAPSTQMGGWLLVT